MRTTDRLAAACGPLSLLLIVIGFGIHHAWQTRSTGTAAIGRFYVEHAGETRVYAGGLIEFIGYLLIVVVGALLVSRLRDGGESWIADAALGGLLLWIALGTITFAAGGALVSRGAELTPSTAAALSDLGQMAYVLSWLPAALFVGCTGLGLRRTRVLGRAFAWSALAVAVLLLAATAFGAAGVDFLALGWLAAAGARLAWRPDSEARWAEAATAR